MNKDKQLAAEIKKLHYQLSFSSDINRKLAEELREFQAKYGARKHKMATEEIELVNLGNFMEELYYVEPLLTAYEQKITKLQDIVSDSQNLIQEFESRAGQLSSENDFLRTELENKCKVLIEKEGSTGMNLKYLKLENQSLKDKQKILLQQIQELKKQVEKLQDSLERITKSTNAQNEIQRLNRAYQEAKEQSRQAQISAIDKEKELEVLRVKLKNEQIISDDLTLKNTELERNLAKQVCENKVLLQQLEALKQLHDQTADQQHSEIESLKSQLASAQRHEADLFQKNLTLENDLQNKSSTLHNLQVQQSTLQTNNANLLQMLESYEGKVAHQAKKIKKLEDQLKIVVDSAKNDSKEKDLLAWKLQEKELQLERREVENRNERERLAKLYEQRMEALRSREQNEKEMLEQEISNARARIIQLQSRAGRV